MGCHVCPDCGGCHCEDCRRRGLPRLSGAEGTSTTLRLYAERQAAVQLDLRDLDRAIANLSQLDPTDPQRNELRVAQEALGSLRATLRGLGLSAQAAQAAECGATP